MVPRRARGTGRAVDLWDADQFEVHEQTMRIGPDETFTLVTITDPRMLDE